MIKLNVLFVILFTCFTFSQQSDAKFDPLHEIFCLTENTSSTTTFKLDPIGTIWDVEWNPAEFTIDTDGSSDGGLFYAAPNPSFYQGYNYIASSEHPDYDQEDFGFGIYKLSAMGCYFYLDWRDTRYGSYNNCSGHCADIWIKYDGNTGKLYYANSISNPTWSSPIQNGSYFPIWVLKNQISYGSPNTSNVPYFWSKCLVLIPTPNNNPHLVWGPHPTFPATHYRIYRGVSNYPVNPLTLNYTLIATVNSLTFDYIDYAVTIQSGYQYAYYYVVGWDGSEESDNSNYVSTEAEFHKKNLERTEEYNLSQNYPNPFNPTTRINYQVAENSKVQLKVFDVLGNEAATLVDEYKQAGSYEVKFDGAKLPGGVYFYKLTAGSYTDTRKMVLLR